jgi:type II secretory pathway pseudopilin PulG
MKPRAAFTLIEALIVIGIILILASLTIPAVAQAVEAARRTKCLSNLRQVGMACLQYHDVHGTLPRPTYVDEKPAGIVHTSGRRISAPSLHAMILPYLDSSDLYDMLNLQRPVYSDRTATINDMAHLTTALSTRVGLFICPSDPNTNAFRAPNSYRGTFSAGPIGFVTGEYPDSFSGVFGGTRIQARNLKFVTDGLSNTAMLSERCVGRDALERAPVTRNAHIVLENAKTADSYVLLCRQLSDPSLNAPQYTSPGKYWLFSGNHHTLYTHVLPPNSAVADCYALAFVSVTGASTARSDHIGMVNLVSADGSARSVDNAIDLSVWRALASRGAGDQVKF